MLQGAWQPGYVAKWLNGNVASLGRGKLRTWHQKVRRRCRAYAKYSWPRGMALTSNVNPKKGKDHVRQRRGACYLLEAAGSARVLDVTHQKTGAADTAPVSQRKPEREYLLNRPFLRLFQVFVSLNRFQLMPVNWHASHNDLAFFRAISRLSSHMKLVPFRARCSRSAICTVVSSSLASSP